MPYALFAIGLVFCISILLLGVYLIIAEAIDTAGSPDDDAGLRD
jgi:hypothetical protein